MFTDTHCHLFEEYYENIEKVVLTAQNSGITKMIVNGTDRTSNTGVLALAQKYSDVFAAIGYHPEALEKPNEIDLDFISSHIEESVAIGEIGLDYHYEPCDREAQKKLFRAQLAIADQYEKPVIIHSRDATEDTIKILKEYPNVTGSIHCFTGSLETAKIYIALGYKLGFGGVVTFKNAKVKEVIKNVPSTSILLETDSPYLSPEPLRGQKNEPANISHIADFISREINVSLEELSRITEENVHALFDI